MKPLRILYVSAAYPPHRIGGADRVGAWLAERFAHHGHELYVLTSKHEDYRTTSHIFRSLENQGDWVEGRKNDFVGRIDRAWRWRRDMDICSQIVSRIRPDIVFLCGIENIFMSPVTAALKHSIPVFYLVEGAWREARTFFEPFTKLERLIFAASGKGAFRPPTPNEFAGVIGCCNYVLDRFREFNVIGSDTATAVAYNSIPLSHFSADNRFEARNAGSLLWVGRLAPDKGVDVAIQALAQLRRQAIGANPPRLTIVTKGTSEALNELTAFAHSLGVRDLITLRTDVSGEAELADIYRSHEIFWMTSIGEEGIPLVILEAMAGGAVTVASDVGGSSEAVTAKSGGFLVPPNSPIELAAVTQQLLLDRSELQLLSRRSVEHVRRYHDIDGMAAQIEQFIQKRLESSSKTSS